MKKKVSVPYPFLFAFYPIYYFYDQNKHEVWFSKTIIPLFFSLLVAGIFFLIFYLLTKEKHRAGICSIIFLSLFFSYSALIDELNKYKIGVLILEQDPNLLISYSSLLTITFILIKKSKKDFSEISYYLNFFTVILILFPLFNILFYKLSLSTPEEKIITDEIKGGSLLIEKRPKPDIYFIVLDEYAREDILRDFYGFRNRDFINFLEKSGFYVGNKSRSNYPVTVPSVTSILNMEYIETRVESMEVNKNEQLNLYQKLENNRVIKFLKSKGYKYIHFTSGARPTDSNKNADETKSASNWISKFTIAFLEKTFLKSLNLSLLDPIKIKQQTILYEFDELEKIPKDKSPTFTFAHIMMPHGPIVFDRNGNTPQNTSMTLDGYIEFVKFANKKTKHLIKTIITNSEVPPIIILQSDHGSELKGQCIQPTKTFIKEKMSILNAYFVPEEIRKHLYENITPVNSFRVLFDYYFGTKLGLIEDKVFFTFCYAKIYQPIRVPNEKDLEMISGEEGFNDKWLKSLEEAVNRFPNNFLALNALGIEYFSKNMFEEAENALKLASNGKDISYLAYKNLGLLFRFQNKNSEAIDAFKKALEKTPNNIALIYFLAETYAQNKNYNKAKPLMDKLSSLHPIWEELNLLRAKVYSEIGDNENAVNEYRKLLTFKFQDVDVHLKIGSAYDQLKDGRNAIFHTIIARQLYAKSNQIEKTKKVGLKIDKLLIKYKLRASDFAHVRLKKLAIDLPLSQKIN